MKPGNATAPATPARRLRRVGVRFMCGNLSFWN
jgi:hypothetical protein